MPVIVNSELVPNEAIREEAQRLKQRPEWRDLPEGVETSMRLRQEAELRLIDRVLIRQEAEKDTSPLDPGVVENEIQRLVTESGCSAAADSGSFRRNVELDLPL